MQQAVEEKRLLPGPGPGSRAVGDIGALADRLLIEKEPASELDIQRFCNLYLQATGINEPGEPDAPEIQSALQQPGESKQELQNQLDYLSGQVDHLIEEVERLRAGRRNSADLLELPRTGQRKEPSFSPPAVCAARIAASILTCSRSSAVISPSTSRLSA